MKNFKEYLDEKGKLQEKPIVDPKADTANDPPKSPETPATKGKTWKSEVPLAGKPHPYTPGTSPCKQQKYEKGLVDDGDKGLIYNPDTEGKDKTVDTWPKTKSEEFVQQTKNLPLSEFANLIAQENKSEDKFPLATLQKANKLISDNPRLMEAFVREVKRNGAFDSLVEEILTHKETINELAFLMTNDLTLCNKLVKAFQENEILETTDAPASETEVTKDDLKDKKLPKAKPVKSIDGQETENMNGIVRTKDSISQEHNLIQAILNNPKTAKLVAQHFNN